MSISYVLRPVESPGHFLFSEPLAQADQTQGLTWPIVMLGQAGVNSEATRRGTMGQTRMTKLE